MHSGVQAVTVAEGSVLEEVRDLRWRSQNEGLSRQAYGRWHTAQLKSPWVRGAQRSCVLLNGRAIRASAERYELDGVLDGRKIRICAIGSVMAGRVANDVTAAPELIDGLVADGARDGAAIALLFLSPDLLAAIPHDWVIPSVDLTLRVTESTRHGAPMATVRVGEERDLAAIAAMGQVRAAPVRFHLDRDRDFIRYVISRKRLLSGLGPAHARQLHFFIAEEGITAAAYVVLSVVGRIWTLEECGDRDPTGARIGALLQALIAREPSQERPVIRGWLPPGLLPPQVTIVSSSPAGIVAVRLLGTAPPTLGGDDVLYWRNDLL